MDLDFDLLCYAHTFIPNTNQSMHLSSLFITLLLLFFQNVLTPATSSSNIPAKIITRLSTDCGSATVNGGEWIGIGSQALQMKGPSPASQLSHTTFHVTPGEKILRLHFNTASYKGFQWFNDLFNVEAGPFTLTWKTPVDAGFRYLVRIHFCDEPHGVSFKVLMNEMIVDSSISQERDGRGILPYRDYVVAVKGWKHEGKRDLMMSLQFVDGHQLIKGLEIFKLSNPDNSSPNAFSPKKDSTSWFIRNLLLILCYKNVTATLIIGTLALINTIVYMLREICEAGVTEEGNRPSARAERLCRRFSLAEMQSATKNFSEALLIGRGGFGKVYRGLIDNGRETVAIKRLNSKSKQGSREFLTEIDTLCELRHINLVSLIGYCSDYKEMILVYEFMPSGTLADHLHKYAKKGNAYCSLTWKRRLHICVGAARGLDYLHTGNGVIHRDVKASNILLDENLVAKVSDFGLAKPEKRSNLQSHVSTKVKGTYGYIDPYYLRTGKLTRKSDTYAFGVVLLEVLCERQAMNGGDDYCLARWARHRINEGEVNQIVASNLMEEILPESLKVYVEVAERCLHDEPKKRPTMAQVVVQLESALELQESTKIAANVCPSYEDMVPSPNTRKSSQGSTEMLNHPLKAYVGKDKHFLFSG